MKMLVLFAMLAQGPIVVRETCGFLPAGACHPRGDIWIGSRR